MEISARIIHAIVNTIILVLLCGAVHMSMAASVQGHDTSEDQTSMHSTGQDDELSTFLSKPVDLAAFKKQKGPSNSGSYKADPWIYRPSKTGFFYRYLLFATPGKYSEEERFGGFTVIVYKFGKKVGDYYDRNEMLVGLWCELKDPDLGKADLVGKTAAEINDRFGEPFAALSDVLVYHQHGRALSIHLKNGAVDWFKYFRLARDLAGPEEVPESLLRPGPR